MVELPDGAVVGERHPRPANVASTAGPGTLARMRSCEPPVSACARREGGRRLLATGDQHVRHAQNRSVHPHFRRRTAALYEVVTGPLGGPLCPTTLLVTLKRSCLPGITCVH